MSQKVCFTCEDCGTDVKVILGDDFDDAEVQYCPVCGSPAPLDDTDDE